MSAEQVPEAAPGDSLIAGSLKPQAPDGLREIRRGKLYRREKTKDLPKRAFDRLEFHRLSSSILAGSERSENNIVMDGSKFGCLYDLVFVYLDGNALPFIAARPENVVIGNNVGCSPREGIL